MLTLSQFSPFAGLSLLYCHIFEFLGVVLKVQFSGKCEFCMALIKEFLQEEWLFNYLIQLLCRHWRRQDL